MKQEDWTKQLRDKLADYEMPAPADLWADIEASLPQPTVVRRRRVVPLWGRVAAAAAIAALVLTGGYLLWPTATEQSVVAVADTPVPPQHRPVSVEQGATTVVAADSPMKSASLFAKAHPMAHQEDVDGVEVQKVQEDLRGEQKTTTPQDASAPPVPSTPDTSPDHVVSQLDEQIAAARRSVRSRISLGLYASNGFGDQSTANPVMMSQTMLSYYDYQQYMLPTSSRARTRETAYLANYEERQVHYQPISFGLTANIPISSNVSVVTGLVYTRLRSDFTNVMGGYPLEQQQTLHYIGVPLAIQYRLWQHGGLHVYATAGGQADFNVKAKFVSEGVSMDVDRDRLQWSLQTAVGLQYDLLQRVGLYVEPGLKYYPDNGSRLKNYLKDKPTNFNLQVGVRLNF